MRTRISLIIESTIEFGEESEEEDEMTYYARNQEERRWVYGHNRGSWVKLQQYTLLLLNMHSTKFYSIDGDNCNKILVLR